MVSVSVVPRRLVVVFAVGTLGACGSVSATLHTVGGEVRGLWSGSDGVALRLEGDGINTLLTASSNGPFNFGKGLSGGASYTVTVVANPPNHSCSVDAGGNGVVADDDVATISVVCMGPTVSIGLSGPWNWVFDPTKDTQTFAGSIIAQDVAFTVSGSSLTGAEIAGAAAVLGQKTAPMRLPPGATTVPIALTASGGLSKTYQLVFDRGGSAIDQMVYGKASNPGTDDAFGYTIAVSGDTLAVGAYLEGSAAIGIDGDQANNDASRAGAVYVFVRTGAAWSQQAYIKASNTGAGDNFGRAIALDGDTLTVGAPLEDSSATGINGNQSDNATNGAGAVYVFVRTGATWMQQAYVKASNTGPLDNFGSSLALSGDTLAVGAIAESSAAIGINGNQADDTANTAGAVYVFTRSGASWTQQAYVKASNTGAGDNFGATVALLGDTLVVGATGESSLATGIDGGQADNSAGRSGAVYVFARTGTNWAQQSYIKASNTQSDDRFGNAIALSGDTLAVAAFGEDSAATGIGGDQTNNSANAAGAVYVFLRFSGTWIQQAYLKASNTGQNYLFGDAIALTNDTLVVGASGENSGASGVGGNETDGTAPRAGAAYVFARSGTTWTQRSYVKASNTGSEDGFGHAVALSKDALMIGALGEASSTPGLNPAGGQTDNAASGAGAFYLFR
jgi:hypothetical protein